MSATEASVHGATLVKGPSAMGSDPRRLARLTWALATTDFKLRFFGSVLGYLWQLMRPLMLFGVLYLVFGVMLDFGGQERFFEVSLLLGIVLFTFLSEATSGAVRSIVNREHIVRKVDFPRLAVPLATVLTAMFNLALNTIPLLVFLFASGGGLRWSWLQMPLLVLWLVAITLGLAMLLSSLYVRYRDVEPIWDVVLQAAFYATPIFYTIATVQEQTKSELLGQLIMCSPFAVIVQQSKHAFIDPSHATAADAIQDPILLVIPALLSVAAIVAGAVVFARAAPRIAEDL